MEAFDPQPPEWTNQAVHAFTFCCPSCHAESMKANKVWINRRSPVYTESQRRKWQEFYLCQCNSAWWAWSTDRPPSPYAPPSDHDGEEYDDEEFDNF